MSVKRGLLSLLAEGPAYGAQLRTMWLERTGETWPLNVGQVYTTLGRLERDGFVTAAGSPDPEGRIAYELTEPGLAEADRWWLEPVVLQENPRDELAIKLALAASAPGVGVTAVIQQQRLASMTALRALTREKARSEDEVASAVGVAGAVGVPAPRGEAGPLARLLVIERLIFAAEAELNWLDQVEARFARR